MSTENESKTDAELIEEAENLINFGHYEEAYDALGKVEEKTARCYFVQGKLYIFKQWYNEARKCFETAIEMEPESEEFKEELNKLDEFVKTDEFKRYKKENKKKALGGACGEGCAECCCLGSAECCCQGICEGLGGC